MNEAKWLACSEPSLMLRYVRLAGSDRKSRLFACACWRNAWNFLDRQERRFVEASEALADELQQGSRFQEDASKVDPEAEAARARALIAEAACRDAADEAGEMTAWKRVMHREAQRQCAIVRCMVGNPFRPPQVSEQWRTWNDGTVVKMARTIYDDRRWNELPILADALEDAGCTDDLLLDHCRMPSEHVRGCHVLDALLDLT